MWFNKKKHIVDHYFFQCNIDNFFYERGGFNIYIVTDSNNFQINEIFITDIYETNIDDYHIKYGIHPNADVSDGYIVEKGVDYGDSVKIYDFEKGFSNKEFKELVDTIVFNLNEKCEYENNKLSNKKTALINKALGEIK